MSAFDAEAIFSCLDRHDVRYVLTGGLAAVLHGSPLPTLDVDICPSREPENLGRLAAALDELGARIRTSDAPEGVSFPREREFLAGVEMLNLRTRHGDLDLSFTPAGTGGFDDLVRDAAEMSIRGLPVPVASLEDVIRSKEAANRPQRPTQSASAPAAAARDPKTPGGLRRVRRPSERRDASASEAAPAAFRCPYGRRWKCMPAKLTTERSSMFHCS